VDAHGIRLADCNDPLKPNAMNSSSFKEAAPSAVASHLMGEVSLAQGEANCVRGVASVVPVVGERMAPSKEEVCRSVFAAAFGFDGD
jgi:hypothetical protein